MGYRKVSKGKYVQNGILTAEDLTGIILDAKSENVTSITLRETSSGSSMKHYITSIVKDLSTKHGVTIKLEP